MRLGRFRITPVVPSGCRRRSPLPFVILIGYLSNRHSYDWSSSWHRSFDWFSSDGARGSDHGPERCHSSLWLALTSEPSFWLVLDPGGTWSPRFKKPPCILVIGSRIGAVHMIGSRPGRARGGCPVLLGVAHAVDVTPGWVTGMLSPPGRPIGRGFPQGHRQWKARTGRAGTNGAPENGGYPGSVLGIKW